MGVIQTWAAWTEGDKAALLEIWKGDKTLKEMMHLLPRHSYIAARSKMGGFGPRPIKVRSHFSACQLAIVSALTNSAPKTAKQIAHVSGASQRRITELLANRNKEQIYIAKWERSRPRGPWMALYALGDGPDAVRPKPITSAERKRKEVANRAARTAPYNPFAVAMNQLNRMAA